MTFIKKLTIKKSFRSIGSNLESDRVFEKVSNVYNRIYKDLSWKLKIDTEIKKEIGKEKKMNDGNFATQGILHEIKSFNLTNKDNAADR